MTGVRHASGGLKFQTDPLPGWSSPCLPSETVYKSALHPLRLEAERGLECVCDPAGDG